MTGSVARILRNPGRLSYGVTDLTTAYPHGGTALGTVRAIAFRPNVKYAQVVAEEFGEPIDAYYAAQSWVVAAILRDMDNDAMGLIFPSSAAGATSQKRLVSAPGSIRAGDQVSPILKLTFTSDAPDGPVVVFHRAIPMLDETAEMRMEEANELEVPFMFRAIRDSAGKMVSFGQREDVTL